MALVVLLLCFSPTQAASDDEWEIIIAPYFFAMSADYDATMDGRTASVDMSFKDIIDDMDVLGGSLRIEAWKGDWGIIADGIYTNMEGDFGPRDSLSTTTTDVMIDLMGARRILKNSLIDRPLSFDIMGGLRYHYLKQRAKFAPGGNISVRVGDSQDWVEPVIGGKTSWFFTEKWAVHARGDMGGFNIGSASKLTWSITSYLTYKLSRNWSVAGGYRHLDMDYSRGSGTSKFGFDGSLNGVIVGIVWRN
jgi:hypothetical protein